MMHQNKTFAMLASGLALVSALTVGKPAWSADDTIAARTERTEAEVYRGPLEREVVGIKPQAGVMVYKNSDGNTDSRLAAAMIVEMNAVTTFYKGNRGLKNWYLGPSTGVVYSHLGDPTSNFFGGDAASRVGQAGSNFLIVPLNLKLGYLFPESNFRFSVRGGGNFTYRSVADAMNFGPSTAGPGSRWRMYPNVGADIELGALMIRPDLTLTPEDQVFTGTVGFNISLG